MAEWLEFGLLVGGCLVFVPFFLAWVHRDETDEERKARHANDCDP